MKKQINLSWIVLCVGLFLLNKPVFAEEGNMVLKIYSSAFAYGGEILAKYTCEGEDLAPDLFWEGIPEGTKSLVLIVDDPDAPDPEAPKITWVHWVVYNIPPETRGFPEGVTPSDLPREAGNGLNDWKRVGYGGPCPPIGRHRYFYKLYALDTVLEGMDHPMKPDVEAAMEGHIISEAMVMGTYKKSDQ